MLQLENQVVADYQPKNCRGGIERFTNGTSNSLEMYKATQNKTQGLFVDPEFGADDTSLNWAKWGFRTIGRGTPPNGLKWKRPAEMGQGYPDKPSLWGELKKPVPNGIS